MAAVSSSTLLIAPIPAAVSTAVPAPRGLEKTAASGRTATDPQTQPAVTAPDETPSSPVLEEALSKLNQSMQAWATRLNFVADKEAQRIVIRIIDSDSGEVIKTIPSEAVLHAARLLNNQTGAAATIAAQA
ncbi:flagellar protein FlaG [Kerstersia gyiorum]|uniref:flagellar protein FlaG n=2 Tax=Kerstersia gyiorum TaxID=206506 RepID=UPI0020A0C984|nr:flagellar protein FlaG [Kerstersia gyiorum]MCP1633309.1 flagellar protein FlaG [Kerstersia gyiorum]MCP1636180.1 flagellar protein FlaG [Kerstersia gyiorum]MCP1671253.1 flagellar protein FlaG [Kerstersia gyiorum]MCP1681892.1 flagellar protein FlaG [Kerstersia gyiorum]MCP1709150.1 flagellar protein FlaG [Kerstersia gyiorum]